MLGLEWDQIDIWPLQQKVIGITPKPRSTSAAKNKPNAALSRIAIFRYYFPLKEQEQAELKPVKEPYSFRPQNRAMSLQMKWTKPH